MRVSHDRRTDRPDARVGVDRRLPNGPAPTVVTVTG